MTYERASVVLCPATGVPVLVLDMAHDLPDTPYPVTPYTPVPEGHRMICDLCATFPGHHSHNEKYHSPLCVCDGSSKHRTALMDDSIQVSIRMNAVLDESKERDAPESPGHYAGSDTPAWSAMSKRLADLLRD